MINLIQPLPFYDYQLEQNQYRENCAGSVPDNCQLVSDNRNLISWQIEIPLAIISITSITLFSPTCIYELTLLANQSVFKIKTDGVKRWIIYTGGQLTFVDANNIQTPLVVKGGLYDWRVVSGGKTYYSEQFLVSGTGICRNVWGIKLQAWNDTIWNGLYFGDDFKFTAYFDTFISNRLSTVADVVNKDGFQRDVLSQRVVSTNYQIKFNPMPNSVALGLSVLTAMKNIQVIERLDPNGDYVNTYDVKNIKFTQTPVEGDCLDLVNIEFSIFDNDYIKTPCNS